jgi:hypothetical protein
MIGTRPRLKPFTTCLTLLAVASHCALALASPAMEIMQKAVDNRLKITQGDIHFTIETANESSHGEYANRQTRRAIFEPGRFRMDASYLYLHELNQDGKPATAHAASLNGETFIAFSDSVTPSGQGMPIEMGELKRMQSNARDLLISPLSLGMSSDTPSKESSVDEDLKIFKDRREEFARTETLDGRMVEHVGWTRPVDGGRFEYWVSPSEGYSIVRARTTVKYPHGLAVENAVITIQQYGSEAFPLWFPQTFESINTMDGKLERKQRVIVTEATLNEPLDPKLFELAGMNPRPGQSISREPSNGKHEIWDGEKIATVEFNHRPKPASTNWTLLLISVAAGMAATVLGWYLLRERQRTA